MPGGALGVLRGALTNFLCKLRLNCFLRPEGAGAPTVPPGYAYAPTVIYLFIIVVVTSLLILSKQNR